MARAYQLGKRALTVAETRAHILDAALALTLDGDMPDASVTAIAQRAGVTRATVYAQFGSLHELLLAVLNDGLDRADVRHVRKALQDPDAGRAARLLMRASCRFWLTEYALFTRVKGLAWGDPEFARLDAMKEDVRRGHIENLAFRLEQQGLLRAGVTQEDAFQIVFLLTSYETLDHHHRQCHLTLDDMTGRLIHILGTTVLA